VVEASVGLKVKKYGRTTSLTKGTITAINATVNVGYDPVLPGLSIKSSFTRWDLS